MQNFQDTFETRKRSFINTFLISMTVPLINLIKNNICFKGEGSCVDLILTNRKYSFKNTTSFEAGLCDHHHLIYSMLKTMFYKDEPKTLIYRDYKAFSLEAFSSALFSKFESQENNEYQTSGKNFDDTLNNQLWNVRS